MSTLSETSSLPAGKLPPELLEDLLALANTGPTPELIVPPTIGEDSAVLALPGGLLAVGTDPITFPTPRPGHFAVCINANDLAVTGAKPEFFTLTILLPEGDCALTARGIIEDAVSTGGELGAFLVGGHTEITSSVTCPVVSVTMFGHLLRNEALRTGGGQAGDHILQVNPCALEGTAILASERGEELKNQVSETQLEEARSLLKDPGICVVGPASLVSRSPKVHAMHDPTEGGVATGLREMAEAANLGIRIHRERLHLLEVTQAVCKPFGIDPLGLISSGCLLLAVAPSSSEEVAATLRNAGYPTADIGELTANRELQLVLPGGETVELPYFAVDELADK